MVRLLLVRHGHVPGIEPARFRGGELDLTERGVREAQLTAQRIARLWRPVMVYTSPRQRCVVTGQTIASASGAPCRSLECLNDLDYGAWTGKTHEEIRQAQPVAYRRWRTLPHLVRFPDGDSLQQLHTRVADALRFAIDTHPHNTVVIVAHDSCNRVMLLHALGLSLSAYWRITQTPCSLNEIVADEDGFTVLRINDTAHLEMLSDS